MLQIQHICKEYRTGDLVQKALDDVSLNLRDNEFVAILGPSGSGKTTLLNIIGGLDRYDSGDLIINGISTKKYKDRDWDSYRNHTIGFVFQSYNLIPHQTVLANVELALTISGIGKSERRERAVKALEKVGLGSQLHKKPNQMSGGQMQRVAIARALVNDPDILLADEPTGALDSETSIQVMELLQEVARDRLVVMVTHNPELAEEYATRIVNLKDGKIRSDTDEFIVDETTLAEPEHQNMGKSSMSFLTALSLSFNNLRTKKARTLLTSFAGSIGIIGIAAILSLSAGVDGYIQSVEEETLSEYPLQIQSTGVDMTAMLAVDPTNTKEEVGEQDVRVIEMVTDMFSTMDSNDLGSLKSYLESGKSGIESYTNAVEYSYGVTPQIFRQDGDGIRQVHPDKSFSAMGLGSSASTNSMMSSMMSTNTFYEMPENENLYKEQYDVRAGRWPEAYNECVVVLTSRGSVSDMLLYTMGLRDSKELDTMVQQFLKEEDVETPEELGTYTYDDFLGKEFKLVNSSDYYEYDPEYQVWKDKSDNQTYMKQLVADGEDIRIVGVVQPAEDANASALTPGIAYPASLTKHVAEKAEKSEIVKQQLANKNTDVFTNEEFGAENGNKALDMNSLFTVNEDALKNAFTFDESALAGGLGNPDFSDAFQTGAASLDLSGAIDLSAVEIDLSSLPPFDLGELMSGIQLNVSAEGMAQTAQKLMEGYQAYAAENPQADYSGLGEAFLNYLTTDDAKAILSKHIGEIIKNSGSVHVSVENMQAMQQELMSGYLEYVAGKEDVENQADKYMMEYLQTEGALQIMAKWSDQIFEIEGDISIPFEQLEMLAADLAAGYQGYAEANGLPDPLKMDDHFTEYLNTESGKQILTEGIAGIVDMQSVEEQVTASLQNYMGEVMGTFSTEVGQALQTQITTAMQQIAAQITGNLENVMRQAMTQVGSQLQSAMGNALSIDADAFAGAFEMGMDEEELKELLMSMGTAEEASYDGNLKKLGYIDFAVPSGINIYPKDFESKEQVVQILDDYNQKMEKAGKEEQVITYTDTVGTLMSSVTNIIDIISYVLIAFVAISLIVSSIMIGIITYISVLERTKEIGILRAMGASKHNVSQVFNAETGIIGLCSGLLGVGLTVLLNIPINAVLHHFIGNADVNAALPVTGGVVLVILSVVLTLIGGLIPSRKAAKQDPATALRTE